MAHHLNHRLAAPHGRRPHSWVPSTAPIGALDLISRQQNLVSGPTLQPLSAFTIATGLFDAPDAIPFMPGCCVFPALFSCLLFYLFPVIDAASIFVLVLVLR
jgi:hypothetical protein